MIEVSSLSKSFSSQPVLDGVTFSVKAGEAFVVLGQSGIGKSVLLKTLAGLLTPDSGHVRIRSRRIGMLFQKNALFDSFTVYENLAFPLTQPLEGVVPLPPAERDKKIKTFLEWVGLSGTEKQFPSELSGGMQKRLGIARALIVEPEVILYDEPTAGLDPITSRMIVELIVRLRKEMGTTLVAVTSDVMRAFQMADRIGLLVRAPSGGARCIEVGTPDETRASTDPAVQQFLKGSAVGPLTSDDLEWASYGEEPALSQLLAEIDHDPF